MKFKKRGNYPWSEGYKVDGDVLELADGDGAWLEVKEMDDAPAIVFPKGQSYFCFFTKDQLDLFYEHASKLFE